MTALKLIAIVAAAIFCFRFLKRHQQTLFQKLEDLTHEAKQDGSGFEHLNASIGQQINEATEAHTLLALAEEHQHNLDAYRQRCAARSHKAQRLAKALATTPFSFVPLSAKERLLSEINAVELQTQRGTERANRLCEHAKDQAESPDRTLFQTLEEIIGKAQNDGRQLEHLNAYIERQINEATEAHTLLALAEGHQHNLDAYRQRCAARAHEGSRLLETLGNVSTSAASMSAQKWLANEIGAAKLKAQHLINKANSLCERAREKATSLIIKRLREAPRNS